MMRTSNGYLVRTRFGDRRDPFREFDNLVRTAFGSTVPSIVPSPVPSPVPSRVVGSGSFSPAVESHREGDDAVIRFELPGVDVAKDVTVELKGRVLVVAGERRDQREEAGEGRHFSEFRYGSFRRTFRLAPHVNADDVSASYDAGVLTVRVAGAFAETEGHKVAITTSTPAAVEGEVTEAHEG
jgi:HSP20 family protein